MWNEYTTEEKIVHLNGQIECFTDINRNLVNQLSNQVNLIKRNNKRIERIKKLLVKLTYEDNNRIKNQKEESKENKDEK